MLPALALLLLSACSLPLDLGPPATRALENGAAASLAGSFELAGIYQESGTQAGIDLQIAGGGHEHMTNGKVEAILLGGPTYFRGGKFLAQHLGSDAQSQAILAAVGNAWWTGLAGTAPPDLPDFTTPAAFTATFLGSAITARNDHAAVNGRAAVELSGPRGDVYVGLDQPHRLLRIAEGAQAVIDGISGADFRYTNFGRDFGIAAPKDVVDFGNLSTLPPIYTVVSVDVSGCADVCVLAAVVRNLGGLKGAKAASRVRFTLTDAASGATVAGCTTAVAPDVGYNATTRVTCTILGVGPQQLNAGIVTATPDNPGHA